MTFPPHLKSLKNRLLLASVLVLVAGLWGLATRVAVVLQGDIEKILSQHLAATVAYVATDIDGKIQLRIDVLKALAATLSPASLADPQRLGRELGKQAATRTFFTSGVAVVDSAGTVIAESVVMPGRLGGNIADRNFFREVMGGKHEAIGSPTLGRFSQRPIVPFAVPIKDAAGKPLAMLFGSAVLSDPSLFAALEQTQIGRTGQIIVTSPRDDLIVSASDKSRILQATPRRGVNPLYDRRAYENFEGSGITVSSRGVEVLTSNRNMRTTGWVVIASIDTEEAFAPILNLKRSIYALALLLSVILVLVLRFILNRQLAVVAAAGAAMREMTEGKTPLAPIAVADDDEIGRLVGNFNRLIEERRRVETALVDSEQRFRTVFDSIDDAIIIGAVEDGAIRNFNRRACAMFGYGCDELRTMRLEDLGAGVAPDGQNGVESWPDLATEAPRRFEWLARTRQGSPFWAEVGVCRVAAGGGAERLLVVVREIGERKRAEQELLMHKESLEEQVQLRTRELVLAREEAEAANQAKTSFLANISHEIRTPMTAIIGMAHLAQTMNPPPSQRDYLDKIRRSGEHLLAIIDDILNFSRIEAGRLELEDIPFAVAGLVRNTVEQIEDRARDKGLVLVCDIDAALPASLTGDPLRLTQVLLNLAGNAIKFTERGQVVIQVAMLEVGAGDVLVRFAVNDTGIGLDVREQARLFQSFEQADASIGRKYGGAGLGLAICKRLVGLMGGAIHVESAPGAGSRFWFDLRLGRPPAVEEGAAGGAASSAAVAPAPNVANLQGVRVLVVDDNPFNQQIAQELLEQVGVLVTLAENGAEALQRLCRQDFDCLLMDMQMPVMDGLEATRRIRSDAAYAAIPIVAMTANGSQEYGETCMAAGMNAFLAKPFLPEKLYAVLLRCLRHDVPAASTIPAATDCAPQRGREEAPAIDVAVLAKAVGDDPQMIGKYLRRFLETASGGQAELETALAQADIARLRFLGHRLKSPALTVGAQAFAELCAALEKLPESNDMQAARETVAEMRRVVDELTAFVGKHARMATGE